MGQDKVFILNTPVSKLKFGGVLEKIKKDLVIGSKITTICTPNPEIIVRAHHNKKFSQCLQKFDLALPDGVGLKLAGKFLGKRIPESIGGVYAMEALIAMAAEQGFAVGLIGGLQGVALELRECLQQRYPGLEVFAVGDFEWGDKGEKGNKGDKVVELVVDRVQRSGKPALIFVGLGAPKQEFFVEKLRTSILGLRTKNSVVLMTVGGAFDEMTGRVPYAPSWVHKMGFKWLWRLILEPWRIKRQIKLFEFIWLVGKGSLTHFYKTLPRRNVGVAQRSSSSRVEW